MLKRLGILAGAAMIAVQPAAAQEAPPQQIDPVRLEAAKATVGYIFPSGTYARIMDRSMDSVMDTMMDSVGNLPLRDIAAIGGKSPEDLQSMGEGTLKEMLEIVDPNYDERMRLTMEAMSVEMSALMGQFEPAFRDGLARAYARRFSIRQLAELNRFFETPTGGLYAAESMVIMTDPEVMKKMAEIMPQMMKQMPEITRKLQQATIGLPPPRQTSQLSAAEKERLAGLLGVPVSQLGQAVR